MQSIPFNIIFAIVLAGGWLSGKIFARLRLPAILGMVVFGIVCSLTLQKSVSPLLWDITPYLKSFALMVILLRAGLGISRATLKKVGRTAFLMAWVPCICEAAALTALLYTVFSFSWPVAALTASMLSAVSPAVVIPSMLDLKARGRGSRNEVPTIIIAGASVDDVFAITLFSVFLSVVTGGSSSYVMAAVTVPLSIVIGVLCGALVGLVLSFIFKRHYATIRATEKALILLVSSMLLVAVGETLHFAALLGLMTMGFILLERHERVAHELSGKLSKIWVFAEIVLFVMIGFSLDPSVALEAGLKGILVISGGLVFRSLGVLLATYGSSLSIKERLFCTIAYLPKATVQAALGGVALSRGVTEGHQILAIAVIAILFTAPLGLVGIRFFGNRC